MHSLYKDYLLDHYRYPRNTGVLSAPYLSAVQENPSCGDSVSVTVHITGSTLSDVRFSAHGCVITVAGASLLSEKLKGKMVDDIMAYTIDVMRELIAIPLGPTRLKCAALPLHALQASLKNCTHALESQ